MDKTITKKKKKIYINIYKYIKNIKKKKINYI